MSKIRESNEPQGIRKQYASFPDSDQKIIRAAAAALRSVEFDPFKGAISWAELAREVAEPGGGQQISRYMRHRVDARYAICEMVLRIDPEVDQERAFIDLFVVGATEMSVAGASLPQRVKEMTDRVIAFKREKQARPRALVSLLALSDWGGKYAAEALAVDLEQERNAQIAAFHTMTAHQGGIMRERENAWVTTEDFVRLATMVCDSAAIHVEIGWSGVEDETVTKGVSSIMAWVLSPPTLRADLPEVLRSDGH